MDHSVIISRCHSKFWLIFFALFVCWYLVLHGFDWSPSFSHPTPLEHQENVIETLDSYTVNVTKNLTSRNETAGDDDDQETESNPESDNEIDWLTNVDEMQALEKELEPELKKYKPLPLPVDDHENEKKNKEKELSAAAEKKKNQVINRLCSGRYIYVHPLPSQFNHEILQDCRAFNKWHDMCPYIENMGLGPNLGNPQRVFSRSGWYSTDQFFLEVIFHNRMKQYECLTNDSSKASAVFVPYYAGLDVSRYLWGYNVSTRDSLSIDLAKWLRKRPEWKAMSGKDHFLVAGRITWDFRRGIDEDEAWGNKLMVLPEFKNMTMLTIEKSPWHSNDFAIPYPTYFHPGNDNEVVEWQNRMKRLKRKVLYSFAGAPRPNMEDSIRGEIMEQCAASRRKCKMLECTDENLKCHRPVYLMKLFQNSIFCLQPPGDSFTRRSTFDSMLAGCIPVFFTPGSAYIQYIWHLPKEFDKYSVLINEEDVKERKVSIEKVLSQIPQRKVAKMREEVIGLIPNLVYADPRSKLERFEDAFDLSVKGVVDRVNKLRKNASSFDFDETFSWKYFLFGSVGKHEWDHYFRPDRSLKKKAMEAATETATATAAETATETEAKDDE